MEEQEEEKVEDHVLRKYRLLEKVGSGSYGHVWKAQCRATRNTVALKKIFDAFRNVKDAQRTYREISILRKLQHHPQLVRLLEVIPARNDRDIYLVFDYMECDLFSVMRQSLLKEPHMRFVIAQMARALAFLHECEVVHRDLKPANVLINSDCRIKLCDFGLSRFLSVKCGEHLNMTEFVATRWYRSPEIIFGSRQYSKETDIWSFGCILGEMLAERPLFNGKTVMDQLEKIMAFVGQPTNEELASLRCDKPSELLQNIKIKKMPPSYWFKQASPEAVDLVYKMLRINPSQRLTAKQVMDHPFVRDYIDITECENVYAKPLVCDINDNERRPVEDYRELIYQSLGVEQREKCPSLQKSPTQRHRKRSLYNCRSQDKFQGRNPSLHNKENARPTAKDNRSYWVKAKQQADKIYSTKVSPRQSPLAVGSLNGSMLSGNGKVEEEHPRARRPLGIHRKNVQKK